MDTATHHNVCGGSRLACPRQVRRYPGPVAPSVSHQLLWAMRSVMGLGMSWRPRQCLFARGAYDKAESAVRAAGVHQYRGVS